MGEKKWETLGGFILDGNIKSRDIDAMDYSKMLFGALCCVSRIVNVVYVGKDFCDVSWELDLLEEAARKIQIGTFLLGINPRFMFKELLVEEKDVIECVYEQEKLDPCSDDVEQELLSLFRDMALDACAVYDGEMTEMGKIKRMNSLWRDFVSFASAYASRETVEEWFYG